MTDEQRITDEQHEAHYAAAHERLLPGLERFCEHINAAPAHLRPAMGALAAVGLFRSTCLARYGAAPSVDDVSVALDDMLKEWAATR